MDFIIKPPISSIAFDICDYHVRIYGIILTFSIIVGLLVSFFLIKYTYDFKRADEFIDFSPCVVIFSIIGARLFYVLGAFGYYKNNLKEILMVNHGGISIYGAIFFGIFVIYLYLRKNKYEIGRYFDILSIATSFAQAIGRWGNYFNQEAFGKPTYSFVKLYVDYKYRPLGLESFSYFHPTFLYESVLDFILFLILITLYYKFKNKKSGVIFSLYLIGYGFIRLFVEYFRIDSIMYIKTFPIAQLISLIVIVLGFANLFVMYLKCNKKTEK